MKKQAKLSKKDAWLKAMRLRTLPLAIASIGMGAFLAAEFRVLHFDIVFLAITTTVLLQILSNLANDYGDTINGADNAQRVGPERMVQSGLITQEEMLRAMIATAVMAMGSGLMLVYNAFSFSQLPLLMTFLVLGAVAIWAAVRYTAGDNPYGYAGLGDLFVFLFFGPVAVMGTFFLQGQTLEWPIVFPAISCGFLSMAVLNVNNIRDIHSDKAAGKYSLPVRIGLVNAYKYHWMILLGAIFSAVAYATIRGGEPGRWLFIIIVPFIMQSGRLVTTKPLKELDPLLKMTSMVTLGFVLLFGIAQVLA